MVHVLFALTYLHSRRVLHRDIKLENVLLEVDKDTSRDSRAYLSDLGFAAVMEGDYVSGRFGTERCAVAVACGCGWCGCMRAFACVTLCVCVCGCVRAFAYVCVCACAHACMRDHGWVPHVATYPSRPDASATAPPLCLPAGACRPRWSSRAAPPRPVMSLPLAW